jgi:hypothetical protein
MKIFNDIAHNLYWIQFNSIKFLDSIQFEWIGIKKNIEFKYIECKFTFNLV